MNDLEFSNAGQLCLLMQYQLVLVVFWQGYWLNFPRIARWGRCRVLGAYLGNSDLVQLEEPRAAAQGELGLLDLLCIEHA
jgi:hypothetical protein